MFSLQIKACKSSAGREVNSWREDTAPFLLSALGIHNKLKMKFLSPVIYQAQDLTKDKQMLKERIHHLNASLWHSGYLKSTYLQQLSSKNTIVPMIYTFNICFKTHWTENMSGGATKDNGQTWNTQIIYRQKLKDWKKIWLSTDSCFCNFFFCLVHFGFCVGGSCELKGYLLSVLETRICCPLKLMLKRILLANMSNFTVHDGVLVF